MGVGGACLPGTSLLGVQRREHGVGVETGWDDGATGHHGPTLTPPGQDLRTGLAAITGTRQLPGNQERDRSEEPRAHLPPPPPVALAGDSLGAWGHRPSLGRAVGHWRQLQGLGTVGRGGHERSVPPPRWPPTRRGHPMLTSGSVGAPWALGSSPSPWSGGAGGPQGLGQR